MEFVKTPQCNKSWGAPAGNDQEKFPVGTLPVLSTHLDNGYPVQISFWRPSPEELARINAGEPIQLWLFSNQHPVVSMAVGATVE